MFSSPYPKKKKKWEKIIKSSHQLIEAAFHTLIFHILINSKHSKSKKLLTNHRSSTSWHEVVYELTNEH